MVFHNYYYHKPGYGTDEMYYIISRKYYIYLMKINGKYISSFYSSSLKFLSRLQINISFKHKDFFDQIIDNKFLS